MTKKIFKNAVRFFFQKNIAANAQEHTLRHEREKKIFLSQPSIQKRNVMDTGKEQTKKKKYAVDSTIPFPTKTLRQICQTHDETTNSKFFPISNFNIKKHW